MEVGSSEKKNVMEKKSEMEKNQKVIVTVMERIQGIEDVAG